MTGRQGRVMVRMADGPPVEMQEMLLPTDERPCNLSRRWSVCLRLRVHDPPSPYLAPKLRRTGLPRQRHLEHHLNLPSGRRGGQVISNIIMAEKTRTFDIKGILHLSRGVLLRHKHGVKVPECRLDKAVGGHLGESARSAVPSGVDFLPVLVSTCDVSLLPLWLSISTARRSGPVRGPPLLLQPSSTPRQLLSARFTEFRSRLHRTPTSATPPPPHSSWARPLYLVASPTRTAPANILIVEKQHTPCQRKSVSSPP